MNKLSTFPFCRLNQLFFVVFSFFFAVAWGVARFSKIHFTCVICVHENVFCVDQKIYPRHRLEQLGSENIR